jgi:hypothetical protein
MKTVQIWIARLCASFLQGASHAGAATLSLVLAHQWSDRVPTLNIEGFATIALSSGVLKLLSFLDFSMTAFLKTNQLPINDEKP